MINQDAPNGRVEGHPATAVTIGNFDGVHEGHAALISTAREAAGNDGRVVALVFDPHPLTRLRPEAAPARLSTFPQRERRLRELGADEVIQLTPTREFLALEAEDFLDRLVTRFNPVAIVEGDDFRFGRNRVGSVDFLRERADAHGYRVIVVDPVERALRDQSVIRVSSSLIRWLLRYGRVEDAAMLLGRPYELTGCVVQGDQRGRTINVPTANLDHGDMLLPKDGIYTGRARRVEGEARTHVGPWYAAAISIGTKPTFGQHPRICEAHLLDYDGPLDDYDWTIELQITHWLRDQLIYRDVQGLTDQLERDIAATRELVSERVTADAPAPA
ncbi:MAG: riboflavin biosynthesis protein RibF [Phycisphaerales bacterium]|nr:MAG: riboflavin biosynthesis protein RibF [Phycisphaerales bacterium]